jgi:magnesium transporter
MMSIRRDVWPLRDVLNRLTPGETPRFGGNVQVYVRDLYGHLVQVIESIEIVREMLAGALEIYLSSVSNRTNEVMKTLTIYAAVFIPLTFIVGVWGMNFDHMPELRHPYGYVGAWGVMLAVAGGILGYFRKNRWM